jgi:hypothetical protein
LRCVDQDISRKHAVEEGAVGKIVPLVVGHDCAGLIAAALVCALALATSQAGAQTEPRGGQLSPGSKQSVSDLEAQVAYQRAFEAVIWAMPAASVYGLRKGSLEVPGMADNVILSDRCKRSTRSSTAFLYWWKLERSSPTRSDHWEHGDTVHRGDHRSAGWSGGDAVGRSRMP